MLWVKIVLNVPRTTGISLLVKDVESVAAISLVKNYIISKESIRTCV